VKILAAVPKMVKRNRGADASSVPHHKRQKVVHEAPTSEEIHTSRQLMQLLAFDQDVQKARHGKANQPWPPTHFVFTDKLEGLQSFKIFLDGLLSENGADDEKVQILRDYLESARRQDSEFEATCLPDVMETWSFAAHSNNDNIMSAAAVTLSLLVKFISTRLDLTAFGLSIGRTLLQPRQQELIARNLSADKGKEFIFSPTLRLLRELICLDGGSLAKPIFRGQSLTFKSLARNMGIKHLGTGLEDPKRPSARTNAIRFFLSALKFLPAEAKAELLSQKELPLALTKSLLDDPPYLIFEILETLRNHVVKDNNLPGYSKSKLLNSMTLGRLASLYQYKHDSAAAEGYTIRVEEAVHEFLILTCTSPSGGVLRPQSGFYPRTVDLDAARLPSAEDEVEPGLESITWMNKFKDDMPVRNSILADFIQSSSLRPWSSQRHSELLVTIFEAAPELVAHYFINKRSFTFEPKLSATWIGYSAFLFKTVEMPLPNFFGHKNRYAQLPPPTSIIIDNIMPLPMDQKILVKCLTQKAELISFVAVRLLVMAIQKLQTALKMHAVAASTQSKPLWDDSARKLVDAFCQRAPGIKEVIFCYREVGESNLLQREAASKLLRLYYEVIPQVALMAKFDVSSLLITAIQRLDEAEESAEDRALRLVELENLLAISGYSPGMRWFSKTQGLSMSPFVALLKVSVAAPPGISLEGLKTALAAVAAEHQLVPSGSGDSLPLLVTLHTMRDSKDLAACDALWALLDNSTSRCATTPIKYLEMMQDFFADQQSDVTTLSGLISPFTFALLEQLPFSLGPAGEEEVSVLACLVATYMSYTKGLNDSDSGFDVLSEKFESAFSENTGGKKLLKKYTKQANATRELQSWGADFSTGEDADQPQAENSQKGEHSLSEGALAELLSAPSSLDQDNAALSKWATKEADELVEEGHAAAVVSLLASEHTSIRKEALVNIAKIAAKIKDSLYEEKDQVWLFLSELVESCKGDVDAGPIPKHIVAFARNALDVLQNPLHCLYGKLNKFLLKGPTWKLDRLPLVYDILQDGPELDDAYYSELSWLFSYLLDGVQGEPDMALYHNTRLFERLLSLASNPYLRPNLRTQILKIIYRATCINGGSTTLITRFGIVSWLEARRAMCGSQMEHETYKALLRRIWETSDKERGSVWSNGGIQDAVKIIAN
jgi:nucleolar pre-ribosomal-associated protein 1